MEGRTSELDATNAVLVSAPQGEAPMPVDAIPVPVDEIREEYGQENEREVAVEDNEPYADMPVVVNPDELPAGLDPNAIEVIVDSAR